MRLTGDGRTPYRKQATEPRRPGCEDRERGQEEVGDPEGGEEGKGGKGTRTEVSERRRRARPFEPATRVEKPTSTTAPRYFALS